MSEQKPCLPECRCNCGITWADHAAVYPHIAKEVSTLADDHAPGCPNAPVTSEYTN